MSIIPHKLINTTAFADMFWYRCILQRNIFTYLIWICHFFYHFFFFSLGHSAMVYAVCVVPSLCILQIIHPGKADWLTSLCEFKWAYRRLKNIIEFFSEKEPDHWFLCCSLSMQVALIAYGDKIYMKMLKNWPTGWNQKQRAAMVIKI